MKTIKKGLLGLLMLFMLLSVSAQEFAIEAEISGIKDGTVIELALGATHAQENAVTSTVVKDGKFELRASTDIPKQFAIRTPRGYNIFSVVVQGGDHLRVVGKATENRGNYIGKDLVFSGSSINEEYQDKMSVKQKLDATYKSNEEKHAPVRAKVDRARESKDATLESEIKKSAEWKALEEDDKAFFKLVGGTYAESIAANKGTWWGPLLTLNFYSFFPPGYGHLYDQLSDEAKNSYYGQILKSKVKPVELAGKQAPAVQAKDRNGKVLDLATISKGKRYILIDFWASWCAPCRKKIPELKAFYEKHKNGGLEILAISIDKKEADWVKASDDEKLPYLDYYDLGETSKNWNVRAIPALFVLDSSGKVVAEEISLQELEKLLLK